MIKIRIPFKTPTVNHLYWHSRNMRVMKKEAKELRKKIIKIVQEDYIPYTNPQMKLKVVIEIHENWLTQAGLVRRKDIANREKFLVDSVFKGLGVDDKFIYESTSRKIQSEEEFAIVSIKPFDLIKKDAKDIKNEHGK